VPTVTFISPDGTTTQVSAEAGRTIMETAVRGNVSGILADCGGTASCATCHVHVESADAHLFVEPDENEQDMLDYTDGVDERSRLSCQLMVTESCGGIRIQVAAGNG
jgi:ferredoxin, 2Fe-2S